MKKIIILAACCLFLDCANAMIAPPVNNPVPVEEVPVARQQLYRAILRLGFNPANYLQHADINIRANGAIIGELLDIAVGPRLLLNSINPNLTPVYVDNLDNLERSAAVAKIDKALKNSAKILLQEKNTGKRTIIEHADVAIIAANRLLTLYNNVLTIAENDDDVAEIRIAIDGLAASVRYLLDLQMSYNAIPGAREGQDYGGDLRTNFAELRTNLRGLRAHIRDAVTHLLEQLLAKDRKIEAQNKVMTLGILSIASVEALLDRGNPQIWKQQVYELLAVDATDTTNRNRVFQGRHTMSEIVDAVNDGIRALFENDEIPNAYEPSGLPQNVNSYLLTRV